MMKTVFLVSVFLVDVFLHVNGSVRTCTNLDNFKYLRRNKDITALGIDVIEDTGLVECAARCKLRNMCKSFSFKHSSGKCKLFSITIEQAGNSFVTQKGTDVSNAEDWPSRIAGPCENNSCSKNEVCEPTSRYSKKCVVVYCPSPPTVANAQPAFTTTYETTKVGSRLSYTCDFNYHPVGNRICLPNGTWSDFKCELDHCPTDDGYVLLENVCIKVVSDRKPVDEARVKCNQSGDRLVVLDTEKKNEVVSDYVSRSLGPAWYIIGLSDVQTEGAFVWEDGSVVTFSKWSPGEPNNNGNEDCVALVPKIKSWIDISCTFSRKYICEKLL
ncbi:macrophage mannose receptor 1-like [Gigantopelta aegis]|uniref:macrophage mannose receptor 1-like n=1 Tax=Gigantopelta aegis TaxID=1735272 RepID=UPI001B88C920|nr:macrophage mannose receptor 1-like [Gigantopelta aegis]